METAAVKRIAPEFDESVFIDPVVSEIGRREARFFVQFGWTEISVDTQAIPNFKLHRGVITPCISFQQIAPKVEIREGDRIPGSETLDQEGKPYYAKYWRFAGDEAERLNRLEAEPSGPWRTGLKEIVSLRGNLRLYRRAGLDTLFFRGLEGLPERNSDVIALLEQRVKDLEERRLDPPVGITPEEMDVLRRVGEELIEAAKDNAELQQRRIEDSHARMKMSPREPEYKRQYDNVDEELLRRTGYHRFTKTEEATATALEVLAGKSSTSSNDDMQQLIALAKLQQEQIQALLAERTETKTKRGGS
jgi:hypothetical protein